MLVALITDQHFGARNDSAYFHDQFERFYAQTFFPEIKHRGVQRVIMLGDTFDRRKYVSYYTLKRARDYYFEPLAATGLPVHVLVGNHDIYYRNTLEINSPRLLLNEYSLDIIEHPREIDLGPARSLLIPWVCATNEKDIRAAIVASEAVYLFGHLELMNFEMHRGVLAREGEDHRQYFKFKRVFTGHYHQPSTRDNVFYLGSPYEMTWADYGQPRGFHVLDTETDTLEFVDNPFTTHVKTFFPRDAEADLSHVRDKRVRVIVSPEGADRSLDAFMTRLNEHDPYSVEIVEDHRHQDEQTLVTLTAAQECRVQTTEQLLDAYLNERVTLPPAERVAVREYVLELFRQVTH